MNLSDIHKEVLGRIKEEIGKDPNNVKYAGKSNAEIVNLLNNPQIVSRVVDDVYTSPINRILSGVPFVANTVTLKDVIDAKAL